LKAVKMPKGNPNPNTSGLRPFKKGESGNPGGKTAEQVAIERRNAEAAMRIREKLLAAAERKLAALGDDDAALELIEAAMLKLIKDAEDRGLGAPIQDLRSGDGSMTPATHIILEGVRPSEG
jgi:hypothetical protein